MLCSQTTVEYAILEQEADKSGKDSPISEILRQIHEDDKASTALVHLLLSEGLRADEEAMAWFIEVVQWVSFSCIRSC
jgi:hypothetical protein